MDLLIGILINSLVYALGFLFGNILWGGAKKIYKGSKKLFRKLFRKSDSKQKERAAIKEQLPLIMNELARHYMMLTPEQREVAAEPFSRLKGNELADFLKDKAPEHQNTILALLREQLPLIIKDGKELASVLFQMPIECRINWLAPLKTELPSIIKDAHELASVLILLTPVSQIFVLEEIEGWPSMIKDGNELASVLQGLAPERHERVIKAVKERLPSIIKDGKELASVLQGLAPEHHERVIKAVKEQLPSMLNSRDKAVPLLELNSKQLGIVHEALKSQYSTSENDSEVRAVPAHQPPEQHTTEFSNNDDASNTWHKRRGSLTTPKKKETMTY